MKALYSSLKVGVGVILGVIIAYFVMRSDVSLAKSGLGNLSPEWKPIETVEAQSWMAQYEKEANGLWYPLKTDSGQILRGFYIPRQMIDTIYAQDSTCDGFRIYLGKRTGAPKRNYCLVFVGTKPAARKSKISEDFGKYYDYVDPCPTNCK